MKEFDIVFTNADFKDTCFGDVRDCPLARASKRLFEVRVFAGVASVMANGKWYQLQDPYVYNNYADDMKVISNGGTVNRVIHIVEII